MSGGSKPLSGKRSRPSTEQKPLNPRMPVITPVRMAKGAASINIPLEVEEHEARLYLAMKMFELGKLSLGQAAKYAGYSVGSFIEILGKHGVPVLNQNADELERDVENAAHGSV